MDLLPVLERINRVRAAAELPRDEDAGTEARLGAAQRLAVYGSLAPGRTNHAVVASLGGSWRAGGVRVHLHEAGWSAGQGFPGLVWDAAGPEVGVQVLESGRLPSAWPELDDFEGPDYLRILVPVELPGGGLVVANLYALRDGLSRDGSAAPPFRRNS